MATVVYEVYGERGELAGGYSVTLTNEGLLLRPTFHGQEIVLRPRHKWLRRRTGETSIEVDTWTICNAFIGGAQQWNALCSLTSPDHLDVTLGT